MARRLPAVAAPFLLLALAAGRLPADPAVPPLRARVEYVYDGDSFRLDGGREVRLTGIDAPEREDPWSDEARDTLRRRIGGVEILLVLTEEGTDGHGRLLAFAHSVPPPGEAAAPDPAASLNVWMVREGHARAYFVAPRPEGREPLLAAQAEARAARRGLWAHEPPADETHYIGSARRFHRPACPHARSIRDPRRFGTRDDCYDAGLSPCRGCKP